MRFEGSDDVYYALYDSGAQVCMISKGILERLDRQAWSKVEGKTVQVRGYVPGQTLRCDVITINLAMGKYGDNYFQHVFCVDPRP